MLNQELVLKPKLTIGKDMFVGAILRASGSACNLLSNVSLRTSVKMGGLSLAGLLLAGCFGGIEIKTTTSEPPKTFIFEENGEFCGGLIYDIAENRMEVHYPDGGYHIYSNSQEPNEFAHCEGGPFDGDFLGRLIVHGQFGDVLPRAVVTGTKLPWSTDVDTAVYSQ
jgi:hypothetical protein